MNKVRTFCIAAAVLLSLAARAGAAEPDAWLPLTKSQVVAIAAQMLPAGYLTAPRLALSTDQRDGLAPGDTVWQIRGKDVPLGITLAGQGERIHTIHIYFPIVNESKEQADLAFTLMGALFSRIYPGWPGAAKWPEDSLNAAWNASPLMSHTQPADPNDLVIRKTLNGITSATVGVPPDIVVYSITARPRCVPDAKRANPFQRVVC